MKRVIIVSILFLLLQVSCQDDWLAPKPLSFFAPENVYVDEAGFESILNVLRRDIKDEMYDNRFHYFVAQYNASDLACFALVPDMRQITPDHTRNHTINSGFLNMYRYIRNSNVLITRVDNIEWESQQARNALVAEALFFRSYWYYRLVNSYGDVPWIGKEITGAKLDFYTTSRWTILERLQSDLEWAVEWLPESGSVGIPTRWAGLHLLTKVYLASTEFDKAIASATEIINGPFALMTQRFGSWKDDWRRNVLWDLHRVENKSLPENTEAIFNAIDRIQAPPHARTNGTYSMMVYPPHYWSIPDETGSTAMSNKDSQADTLGHGQYQVPSNYFANYALWKEFGHDYKTTPDLRRADINWVEPYEIRYQTGPNAGEPINPNNLVNQADTSWIYGAWPHYKTFVDPVLHGRIGDINGGGPGDWYIFRLGETYLLRAEAYFWKGDLGLAANDINTVRQRANAITITPSDVTIDYIFHERARELFAEEPRHGEMARVSNIMAKLNIDGYRLDNFSEKNWWYDRQMRFNNWYYNRPGYQRRSGPESYIDPYHAYWPIPHRVIVSNTQGHINQNIGYVGSENNIPPLETIID